MRLLVIAATILSLAISASAQDMSRGGRHKKTEQKTDTPAVKANDKDYKAALDRLPPQKYDPWGTMRPADQKH